MASHEQGSHLTRAWRHLERPVRLLVYLLIALTVVMLYHQTEFLVGHLFNVLLLFVFAAIIALLLTPVIDRMEMLTIFKGRRAIAVLLLYVVIIGLVAGLIALVTPALIGQAKQLPDLETRAIAFVKSLQDAIDSAGIPLQLSLPSGPGGISTAVLGSVLGILSGTLGTLINILLVLVISIYLLVEGRQLIASMRKLFPGREEVYDFTLLAVGTTVGQYARGQLIMSFVMGTYTGLAMTLIGVPYAVVLGILTFFLEFIPLIGAPVGMGVAVLIALAFKGPFIGLLALVAALGGHAIEAYILGPRVTGSATRIHPLVAMAALLIGAELAGILGALFGVPLAALANVFLGALYRARRGEDTRAHPGRCTPRRCRACPRRSAKRPRKARSRTSLCRTPRAKSSALRLRSHPEKRSASCFQIDGCRRLHDPGNRHLAGWTAQHDAGTAGKRHQGADLGIARAAGTPCHRHRHVAAEDLLQLSRHRVPIHHQRRIHVCLVIIHRSASSGSGWTKAFRANLFSRKFHLNQRVRDRLHQQRGSADVDASTLVERLDDFRQHRRVDSAPIPGPTCGRLPGEGVQDLERMVAAGQAVELVAIDHIVRGAAAIQQPGG